MSYGDGGYYFLQRVGWGPTEGSADYGYAEALPSAREEKAKSWRTKFKGYDVVRRPKNLKDEKERRAWLAFFKAKRNFWQKKKAQHEKAIADASRMGPVPYGKAKQEFEPKIRACKARAAWYKSCIKYIEKATTMEQLFGMLKPADVFKAEQAANAAAAVEADAALVAEAKDVPEATAEDVAAADPETPEAKAEDVAEVTAIVPAAEPKTADFKPAPEDVKTVSTDAPEAQAEEETFFSKYGMYIGGAVILGGAAYFFRDSLGFGGNKS